MAIDSTWLIKFMHALALLYQLLHSVWFAKNIFRLILSVSLSMLLQHFLTRLKPPLPHSSTNSFFSFFGFLMGRLRLPVHSIITVFVESKFKRNRPPQKERLWIAGARARRICFSLLLLCPWKMLVYLLPLQPNQTYIESSIESSHTNEVIEREKVKKQNSTCFMFDIYRSEIERKQTPNIVRCCSGAEIEVFLFIRQHGNMAVHIHSIEKARG